MEYIIITNNDKVVDQSNQIIFVDGSYRDVLTTVRDYVHMGYRLATSVLPASIRMFYSPVRSVIIYADKSEVDTVSLKIAEDGILMYDKSMGIRNVDHKNAEDYKIIDKELLLSALSELGRLE